MPTQTDYLKLTKPANSEYQDTWDEPTNKNWDTVDSFAKDFGTELHNARFGKTSLTTYLEIGHNNDGSNKATDEIKNSRVSFQHGDEDASDNDILLNQRLNIFDEENYSAKESYAKLRDALASREFGPDKVISGSKDGNGSPTWLGSTGANVNIDGSITPLWMMIAGYKNRVRSLKQIPISGGAGIKYLYAQFLPIGEEVANEASQNGTIGSDGDKIRILDDQTKDFTSMNVKAQDILEILGTTAASGKYVIREIAPSGDVKQLKIWGKFPSVALTGLDYKIYDPVGIQLGYDDSKVIVAGKFYFGEAEYDGSAITSEISIHFNDYYVGDWRPVDLTSSVDFQETWNHLMLDDVLDVVVQVSQENDGSVPVEILSMAGLTNELTPNVTNTLELDPDSGSGGDQNLVGTVNVSHDGDVYMNRSVIAWYSDRQINIKNAHSGLFYKDYQGNNRQVGYIRVLMRKIRK